jgi:hypothetical protein
MFVIPKRDTATDPKAMATPKPGGKKKLARKLHFGGNDERTHWSAKTHTGRG